MSRPSRSPIRRSSSRASISIPIIPSPDHVENSAGNGAVNRQADTSSRLTPTRSYPASSYGTLPSTVPSFSSSVRVEVNSNNELRRSTRTPPGHNGNSNNHNMSGANQNQSPRSRRISLRSPARSSTAGANILSAQAKKRQRPHDSVLPDDDSNKRSRNRGGGWRQQRNVLSESEAALVAAGQPLTGNNASTVAVPPAAASSSNSTAAYRRPPARKYRGRGGRVVARTEHRTESNYQQSSTHSQQQHPYSQSQATSSSNNQSNSGNRRQLRSSHRNKSRNKGGTTPYNSTAFLMSSVHHAPTDSSNLLVPASAQYGTMAHQILSVASPPFQPHVQSERREDGNPPAMDEMEDVTMNSIGEEESSGNDWRDDLHEAAQKLRHHGGHHASSWKAADANLELPPEPQSAKFTKRRARGGKRQQNRKKRIQQRLLQQDANATAAADGQSSAAAAAPSLVAPHPTRRSHLLPPLSHSASASNLAAFNSNSITPHTFTPGAAPAAAAAATAAAATVNHPSTRSSSRSPATSFLQLRHTPPTITPPPAYN